MSERDLNCRILTFLNRRATLNLVAAWARIVFGLPLCLVPPFVLGTIFWFAYGNLFDTWYSWQWFFLGTSAIALPLLFLLELRTRGDYLGDVARNPGFIAPGSDLMVIAAHVGIGPLAGIGASVVTSPRLASSGLTEIFLLGPRMIINGIRHLKHTHVLRTADRKRAAILVAQLLASTRSKPVAELCHKGETRADLLPVLCWLAIYGWIGVSEKSENVILFSESRQQFQLS